MQRHLLEMILTSLVDVLSIEQEESNASPSPSILLIFIVFHLGRYGLLSRKISVPGVPRIYSPIVYNLRKKL